jgi:hypothetical protein
MEICLRGCRIFDYVYIIEGLTLSLSSRHVLKDLGLVFQDIQMSVITVEKAPLMVTEHCQALDKLISEFPELFDNRCSIKKDRAYHIDLEVNAIPTATGACHTTPEPYTLALKKELDELVA